MRMSEPPDLARLKFVLDTLVNGDTIGKVLTIFSVVGSALAVSLKFYAYLVKSKNWRLHNKSLQGAKTEDERKVIASNPPPDLPTILSTFGILLFGASLMAAIYPANKIIAAWDDFCPRKCPHGETCHNGVCGVIVRPRPSQPTSTVMLTETPCIDQLNPLDCGRRRD